MLKGILRVLDGGRVAFYCPGCKSHHSVNVVPNGKEPAWGFNGDYDKPTFSPSVLVTSGHYLQWRQPGDSCWCTYNAEHPDKPAPYVCEKCHSFVKDGQIQFLADSTHALSGQTVPLTIMSNDGEES